MKYFILMALLTFLTCQSTSQSTNKTQLGWDDQVSYHKDESTNLCFAIFHQGYHGVSAVLVPCDSIKNKLQ